MANERFIADLLHTLELQLRKKLSEISLDRTEIERLVGQMVGGAAGGGSIQLLESLGRIREGASQKDVIHTLLAEMSWQCRGACIVILGGSSSFVWPGPGMGLPVGKKAGSVKLPVNLAGNSLIVRAATTGDVLQSPYPGTPTEAGIYRSLGVQPPAAFTCVPMSINGRVQGVVIADSETGSLVDPAALAIMVGIAGMVIETLPFRERIGFSQFPRLRTAAAAATPAVQAVSDDVPFETAAPPRPAPHKPVAAPLKPVEPTPRPVAKPAAVIPTPAPARSVAPPPKPVVRETPPPPPPVVAAEPEPEEESPAPATMGGLVDDYARELEMQIGIDEVESDNIEIEVSDADLDAVRDEMASASMPAAPGDTIKTSAEPSFEIEVDDQPASAATHDMEIEFLESPDEVIYSQPSPIDASQDFLSLDKVSVSSAEPAPPPPVVEEPAITAEVEPPPTPASFPTPLPVSVSTAAREPRSETAELPGYNLERFSGEERKQHEKAVRFARLLVSEIKLYNEESVKQGRQFKDLAMRLREDIARSRALYDQRIPPPVRAQTDYFHGELVRQLADGDASLLG